MQFILGKVCYGQGRNKKIKLKGTNLKELFQKVKISVILLQKL